MPWPPPLQWALVPVDIHIADFVTIGLLVVIETLLSADNALVMAVVVLGLPGDERQRALNYGMVGSLVLRIIATLLAIYLMQFLWVKAGGGAYLLYLAAQHFWGHPDRVDRHTPPAAQPAFGLSAFGATVVRLQAMNLAFSIDSILVAVAVSHKPWVVISGGLIGIAALRIVVGQLLKLIERYPSLIDAAFVIIAWVGIKLILEYAHQTMWISFEIPTTWSLGVIVVVFAAAYLYARLKESQT
jgi:YkoY family integral membrane protein